MVMDKQQSSNNSEYISFKDVSDDQNDTSIQNNISVI